MIKLDPMPDFPDATFVEDTAVVFDDTAVIMQPGADSRRGEVFGIIPALSDFFKKLDFIQPPGRIDGGDVCIAGDKMFIGISDRTNESGAKQLAGFARSSYTAKTIDIRKVKGALHLKSGMAYLGDNRILAVGALANRREFDDFEVVVVPRGEEYAANCVRINDHLLMPLGFPKTQRKLSDLGYKIILVNVSEFAKMDGGVSCLSIRF
jgi:dimethylargininase